MNKITRPTLVIDEAIVRKNMADMAEKARANNVELRPHFKTHQSHLVGKWFQDYGVAKITVSSMRMAQYFAQNSWKDITLAFPFNPLEIELLNELSETTKINLLVESENVIHFLGKNVKQPTHLFIKIDLGAHRTGIDPSNTAQILNLIALINHYDNLFFSGFLGHAGHSYGCKSKHEIMKVHKDSMKIMRSLKTRFDPKIISIGDTPTCSIADDFSWADEIRPGNFVYYDLMQTQISSCELSQVAIAMKCPIVACHSARNELIIHGGGVHFSKDHLTIEGKTIFGLVVSSDHWSTPIEGAILTKLSQEHGTVQMPAEYLNQYKEGDLLTILPVHSCMSVHSMKQARTLNGALIDIMP